MKNEYKIESKIYKVHDERYIKITRNQLRILDSLFIDGGKEEKYYDNKNKLRYSEHSGLLDFSKSRLDRVIINAKQNLSDEEDHEILLPDNMIDAIDFEYIFHTHPNTPNFLSRIKDGILYEFPSVSDLFHYIDHHNLGKTQGSIIISSEGIYIIKNIKKGEIKIQDEANLEDYLEKEISEIQLNAIYSFNLENKKRLTDKEFKKIINDKRYIEMYNSLIKDLNLKIFYKPRVKSKDNWILDNLYLKVKPVE